MLEIAKLKNPEDMISFFYVRVCVVYLVLLMHTQLLLCPAHSGMAPHSHQK